MARKPIAGVLRSEVAEPPRRVRSSSDRRDKLVFGDIGMSAIAGRGRVDFRFAVDNDGELYILTKSDGMIGITISIIEEQRGEQPPDLTDDQWDHGSSESDIFAVIKRGLPPTMMPGFDGHIPDDDIWKIVNYLRTLPPKKEASQFRAPSSLIREGNRAMTVIGGDK